MFLKWCKVDVGVLYAWRKVDVIMQNEAGKGVSDSILCFHYLESLSCD